MSERGITPVAYTNRVCAEGLHFSAFHCPSIYHQTSSSHIYHRPTRQDLTCISPPPPPPPPSKKISVNNNIMQFLKHTHTMQTLTPHLPHTHPEPPQQVLLVSVCWLLTQRSDQVAQPVWVHMGCGGATTDHSRAPVHLPASSDLVIAPVPSDQQSHIYHRPTQQDLTCIPPPSPIPLPQSIFIKSTKYKPFISIIMIIILKIFSNYILPHIPLNQLYSITNFNPVLQGRQQVHNNRVRIQERHPRVDTKYMCIVSISHRYC